MLNSNAIADLKAAIYEEGERYATTISVLTNLAASGSFDFAQIERVEAALQPRRDELAAINRAAYHAAEVLGYKLSPLPFLPAPAPLSTEEEKLLEDAWCSYFNI